MKFDFLDKSLNFTENPWGFENDHYSRVEIFDFQKNIFSDNKKLVYECIATKIRDVAILISAKSRLESFRAAHRNTIEM